MRWIFHYAKRFSFSPADYQRPGLGGSESSLVLLTRQLVASGHEVEVFNCCWKPGVYDGVRWRLCSELPHAYDPDVSVAVRFEESIWPTQARRKLFWMLDDQPEGAFRFWSVYPNGTVIVCSKVQMNLLGDRVHKVISLPLPVDLSQFVIDQERSKACLFCSMPNRGLDVALKIWPRISQRVQASELWVTSGWDLWGYTKTEVEERWQAILAGICLAESVKLFRAVSRAKLVELQQRASVVLYPCRFREMFCLSVAEASAAGTPVVTSSIGALNERVQHLKTGALVLGNINLPSIQHEFVIETERLLHDESHWKECSRRSRIMAEQYSMVKIAQQWETLARESKCAQ